MGRSPCCEKLGLKKGPWTPEEDQKLLAYIQEHGHGSWRALPTKAGLHRCGKSCRLRWTNYLRPDIKRGKFSAHEEQSIIQLHALLGNRWSAIATHLPKRTDNEIKNYWNTHLKKRLTKMGIDPVTHKPKSDALSSIVAGQSTNLSHLAQWESARLEAEARLARESKLRSNTTSLIQKPKSGSSGLSGMASASSSTSALLLNKMATQPGAQALCFDVLRAWEGIKPKTTTVSGSIIGLGSNQYLESPTSTLNFSENSISIPHGNYSNGNTEFGVMKEECDHDHGDWKGYEKCVDDVVSAVDDQWRFEPLKIGDGQEPVMNFVDGFTDFILGHESDDPQDDHGNGNGDEFDHENKNYWNNIFNLMNTSPSESPVI